MNLTTHFALHEFLFSETAARQGIDIVPTERDIANLQRLCSFILELLRVRLGRPFVITSGLRPLWLNDEIGGADGSYHITGCAADIKIVGMSPGTFFRWTRMQDDIPIDCAILEFQSWVHIQIAREGELPRKRFLIASHQAGKTVYEAA